MNNIFLTASWRKLIMANYTIDPAILNAYIPKGVELDLYDSKCLVSLVGFLFDEVRLKGLAIPYHTRFPEINLRFYVKQKTDDGWRRGVVFVKELVPRRAIAYVAQAFYGEPYQAVPIQHAWNETANEQEITYRWYVKNWMHMSVQADLQPQPLAPFSLEEFITEHYWGYTSRKKGLTQTYEVQHPRWDVYTINNFSINADMKLLYGPAFASINSSEPYSVLLAEGSNISVRENNILPNLT